MNKELEALVYLVCMFWGLIGIGGGLGYLVYSMKPNLLEPKIWDNHGA